MQEYRVIIDGRGTEFWHNNNNQFHREDDKPAVVFTNGTQYWYKNDKRHRENGPAIIYYNGDEHWYLNGELHCESGPAIMRNDGSQEWWINGVRQPNPNIIKELTVADIEALLGHRVKVVK
jgi:hypothetical protein